MRVVTLPNGRQCGLGVYVAAWKTLRTMSASEKVRGFSWDAAPAASILSELRVGMHDRINKTLPQTGRKWDADYQRHIAFDAREANTPRLIVRRFRTPSLNSRLAHRLTTEND